VSEGVVLRQVGDKVEEFVASHLQARGWEIIRRNYQGRAFEIDLIASGGATLAFVEVKFRKRFPEIWPGLRVLLPVAKKRAMRHGAAHFLSCTSLNLAGFENFRYDLAFVTPVLAGQGFRLKYYPGIFS